MDRGSEFTNNELRGIFRKSGIQPIYITTTADSSSNGITERTNLTLLNDCRTLLAATGLPNQLWFHAVSFATLMRNAFHTSSIKSTPRAKAGLVGLAASSLLPFGQDVILHTPNTHSKLDVRGLKAFALTPSNESHRYLFYVPSSHKVVDSSNFSLIRGDKATATESAPNVFDELLALYDSTIATPTLVPAPDVQIHRKDDGVQPVDILPIIDDIAKDVELQPYLETLDELAQSALRKSTQEDSNLDNEIDMISENALHSENPAVSGDDSAPYLNLHLVCHLLMKLSILPRKRSSVWAMIILVLLPKIQLPVLIQVPLLVLIQALLPILLQTQLLVLLKLQIPVLF
ncbi:hypothetical protein TBLA_0E02360 [Henningerozyma blattae CBS 6284]|uniref:Integrase catalytic domain-containing protein n=1 Tax=Henningerozyma blattae (strain ATCC 34711 / CBS 6284 / DSM 70876 / NBRC 10599 / NRRL Y-10934 / UCD 77-7) TaxID=1071380 RepID=I2H4I9_HENB6|nr:hypothetical protein TBLA_0E02360 [Tetrapisispora blattae CBS 6284]CCH61291.1 hypothetical protein TBLA_0E02360 [Tetrapisispora blattae CBS 6284]